MVTLDSTSNTFTEKGNGRGNKKKKHDQPPQNSQVVVTSSSGCSQREPKLN